MQISISEIRLTLTCIRLEGWTDLELEVGIDFLYALSKKYVDSNIKFLMDRKDIFSHEMGRWKST